MTLRLGIHYSGQSPEGNWEQLYRAILKQAREAEELGYEVFSVAEHHFLPDGWIPTPMVFLSGLAAVTERIELVTNIVIFRCTIRSRWQNALLFSISCPVADCRLASPLDGETRSSRHSA